MAQKILDGEERKRYAKNYFQHYPERRLKFEYSNLNLPKIGVSFRTRQQDPCAWFTVKYIPEKGQAAIHLRVPIKDQWNDFADFLDLDIYFPKDQVMEMVKVLEQAPPPKGLESIHARTVSMADLHTLIERIKRNLSPQGSKAKHHPRRSKQREVNPHHGRGKRATK